MGRALAFAQFQQALVRGTIETVYLLEGEEIFFHEEAIRLLSSAVLPAGSGAVDRETLRGPEVSLAEVLDLASTYPMGGGRRLVVVREADGLRAESAEPLQRYLERPNPKGCLVFSGTRFDRRRALYRALAAGAARVDCAPLDEGRLTAFVRERLRSRGYGISPELAEAVAAGAGAAGGLARLDAELTKLMSAAGSPRPIEPADLAILSGVPRVADTFRLAARVIRGERGEAIADVRALLRAGEDPVRLLGGLSWYFRNALRARVAASRRIPPREVASVYGLSPDRVARFAGEVGRVPLAALQEALARCLQADRELKGMGARDPAHALERLVHRVARAAGERS
jgi:DNA polymerase-3 subunit delta